LPDAFSQYAAAMVIGSGKGRLQPPALAADDAISDSFRIMRSAPQHTDTA